MASKAEWRSSACSFLAFVRHADLRKQVLTLVLMPFSSGFPALTNGAHTHNAGEVPADAAAPMAMVRFLRALLLSFKTYLTLIQQILWITELAN